VWRTAVGFIVSMNTAHGKCASAKKSHVSCYAWGHDRRDTMGYNGSLLCVYYMNGRSLVGAQARQKWLILLCEELMGIWWLPDIDDRHHHHSQGNHHENPKSCMTDLQGKNQFSAWYSKPSPFAVDAFLKNPKNSETVMCEVKTIWLMINKNINICVGVYWNDGGVSGLKLSGWPNSDLQCEASCLPQSFFCDAQSLLFMNWYTIELL